MQRKFKQKKRNYKIQDESFSTLGVENDLLYMTQNLEEIKVKVSKPNYIKPQHSARPSLPYQQPKDSKKVA